jgi:hypothetical protein
MFCYIVWTRLYAFTRVVRSQSILQRLLRRQIKKKHPLWLKCTNLSSKQQQNIMDYIKIQNRHNRILLTDAMRCAVH